MAKRVAFLVASEGIEQVELTDPWKAVTDAGHEAVVVAQDETVDEVAHERDAPDVRREGNHEVLGHGPTLTATGAARPGCRTSGERQPLCG